MVGSAFSDSKVAIGLLPLLILPFMLFSGFYANRKDLLVWIGWLEYISPFKYSLEASMFNEFEGAKLKLSPIEMFGLELG